MKSIFIEQRLHLQVPRVRQDQAGEGLLQGRSSLYQKDKKKCYLGLDRILLWPDTGYMAKYPAGNRLSGQIFGWIPAI
mgnify:CR=1 FL=1